MMVGRMFSNDCRQWNMLCTRQQVILFENSLSSSRTSIFKLPKRNRWQSKAKFDNKSRVQVHSRKKIPIMSNKFHRHHLFPFSPSSSNALECVGVVTWKSFANECVRIQLDVLRAFVFKTNEWHVSVRQNTPNIWGFRNKLLVNSFIWHPRRQWHQNASIHLYHRKIHADNVALTHYSDPKPNTRKKKKSVHRFYFVVVINGNNFIVIDNTV